MGISEDGVSAENYLWLMKSRYADLGTTFRTTWDLYIKFYTVFLSFNIIGLGYFLSKDLSIKNYIKDVLFAVFAVQSALLCVTSYLMAQYSKNASVDQAQLEKDLLGPSQ